MQRVFHRLDELGHEAGRQGPVAQPERLAIKLGLHAHSHLGLNDRDAQQLVQP